MDENTIQEICCNNEILSHYFAGIVAWSDIESSDISLHKLGSFVIINFENSHWFAIQKIGEDKALIFDSFGGGCIPSKNDLRNASINLFSPHPKRLTLDFVVSKSNVLQKSNSLSCGEHVINFLLYSCKSLKCFNQIEKNYASKLIKVSKKLNISCDMYVWNKIYNILHLAPKPNLAEVCEWYGIFTKF